MSETHNTLYTERDNRRMAVGVEFSRYNTAKHWARTQGIEQRVWSVCAGGIGEKTQKGGSFIRGGFLFVWQTGAKTHHQRNGYFYFLTWLSCCSAAGRSGWKILGKIYKEQYSSLHNAPQSSMTDSNRQTATSEKVGGWEADALWVKESKKNI